MSRDDAQARLADFPLAFRQALAFHELLRCAGIRADDIFVGVRQKNLCVVFGKMAIPVGLPGKKWRDRWFVAAHAWNHAPAEEQVRVLDETLGRIDHVRFLVTLADEMNRVGLVPNTPPPYSTENA